MRIGLAAPWKVLAGALCAAALCVSPARATPAKPCPGDCDGSRQVTIDELIRGVSLAMGHAVAPPCPPFDVNDDGQVEIDEVVDAVAAALGSCDAPCQAEPCDGPCAGIAPQASDTLDTVLVASGLLNPLYATAPPGDVHRLFIVEQRGRIRLVKDGELLATPFLDLTAKIVSGGERGLLGLAFHPDYADNGVFFVDYTAMEGEQLISFVTRWRVSADRDRADADSETLVLRQVQPFVAHNGGQLNFGPDGMLYISFGDGGVSSRMQNNAQDLSTWLGKILRIDIDAAAPYAVPPDNPFVGVAGALPEIWLLGLRNPWRTSIDPVTGLTYIGDVGEGTYEEIDVAAAPGGSNFGWCCREANATFERCFEFARTCPSGGLTAPALVYDHSEGCSVTGGFVYRGCAMPALHGAYFYGDYCTGFVRSFVYRDGAVTDPRDWTADLAPGSSRTIDRIAGFGTDARGEIYICDFQGGEVYKIVPGGITAGLKTERKP